MKTTTLCETAYIIGLTLGIISMIIAHGMSNPISYVVCFVIGAIGMAIVKFMTRNTNGEV